MIIYINLKISKLFIYIKKKLLIKPYIIILLKDY